VNDYKNKGINCFIERIAKAKFDFIMYFCKNIDNKLADIRPQSTNDIISSHSNENIKDQYDSGKIASCYLNNNTSTNNLSNNIIYNGDNIENSKFQNIRDYNIDCVASLNNYTKSKSREFNKASSLNTIYFNKLNLNPEIDYYNIVYDESNQVQEQSKSSNKLFNKQNSRLLFEKLFSSYNMKDKVEIEQYLIFQKDLIETDFISSIIECELFDTNIGEYEVLKPIKANKIDFTKFNYITEISYRNKQNTLNNILKYHLNLKLAIWKYNRVKSKNTEICRICEKSFAMKDFYLHSAFCVERLVHLQVLNEINKKLKHSLKKLIEYRDEFKRNSKPSTQKIINKKSNLSLFNNNFEEDEITEYVLDTAALKQMNIINKLIQSLKKQIRHFKVKDYIIVPYKLVNLKNLIYFIIKLFIENTKNETKKYINNEKLNKIYRELIHLFLKTEKSLEYLLNHSFKKETIKNQKNLYTNKQLNLKLEKFNTELFYRKMFNTNIKKRSTDILSPYFEQDRNYYTKL